MNGFDADSVRRVAAALQTNERYIEKDWHLVRALAVIASVTVEGVAAALSGGTSLATAWRLIHRFSEDIDFKVTIEAASSKEESARRRQFRNEVVRHLEAAGFVLDGAPLIGNRSQFFRVSFHYGPQFPDAAGIRPGLQVEMTFKRPALAPPSLPVQSLLSRALKTVPEVPALLCVDAVETAADKVSALAWRTAARNRSDPDDDPSIVRHLHDLAALAGQVAGSEAFVPLVKQSLDVDARRAGKAGTSGSGLLEAMLPAIKADAQWRREYERFVGAVSFGPDDERISFDQAIAACEGLVARIIAS